MKNSKLEQPKLDQQRPYRGLCIAATLAAVMLLPLIAQAQIATVNAASFRAGFPVAPGGLVSAFGTFTDAATEAAATVPLPTTLGGATVTVGTTPAALIFVSATQINFQVPSGTPLGQAVSLTVAVGGAEVAAGTLVASSTDPGLFSLNPADPIQPAAVVNADGSINGPGSPAARGETVLFFGSGVGPLDNTPADGAPPSGLSTGTETARAFFSAQEGAVAFSGLAPGFVGLWQLNVTIPSDAFISGQVPVLVNLGGRASNQVTIFVAP